MARKPNLLREQIKALQALVKSDRAARREIERPIRAGRKPLAGDVARSIKIVARWQAKVAEQLFARSTGSISGGWRLDEFDKELAIAEATLRARLTELQTFDALHNIEADYVIPILDRDAVIRAAKADVENRTRHIRELMARDGYQWKSR